MYFAIFEQTWCYLKGAAKKISINYKIREIQDMDCFILYIAGKSMVTWNKIDPVKLCENSKFDFIFHLQQCLDCLLVNHGSTVALKWKLSVEFLKKMKTGHSR